MPPEVLVVEDEEGVRDLIVDTLRLAGFATLAASHGQEALRIIREHTPDLAVLDITMPGLSGFDVLQRIREAGHPLPVIILTARQDKSDVRRGFELGADDFIRKPFSVEELVLRIRAVLRRYVGDGDAEAISVGRITLDEARHTVTCDGEPVSLSATEFRLLSVFMRDVDRVLTRESLLGRVWGLEGDIETTVLDTYVSYLRRKLGPELRIRTVRGVGYQMLSREPG